MGDVKVGIVGTDNSHAHQYAAFINGWSENEPIPVRLRPDRLAPAMYHWAMALRELQSEDPPRAPVQGAVVSRIWSDDREHAELIARACGIAVICDEPHEATQDVDAVMVLSEDPRTHLEYARPALERGLPTYIDKPLAHDIQTARKLFKLAGSHGAPCFTGSSVRYSRELLAARETAAQTIGDVRAVYMQSPRDLRLYGIHAVEMVNVFLGCDVRRVQAIRGAGRETVLLEFGDRRTAVFDNISAISRPSHNGMLFGSRGDMSIVVRQFGMIPFGLVERFVAMARDRVVPVPEAESLRLMEIVFAALDSLESGKAVDLQAFSVRAG